MYNVDLLAELIRIKWGEQIAAPELNAVAELQPLGIASGRGDRIFT